MNSRPLGDQAEYIKNQAEESFHEATSVFTKITKTRAKMLADMVRGLPLANGVLDAGCRTGYAMETFREELPPGTRIAGVEIVPAFAEQAERFGEVHEADLHDLSLFEDGEFDWVFSSHSLEHCHDPRRVAQELLRVAAVGAFIIVPLERSYDNEAHYSFSDDLIDWLVLFKNPNWRVTAAQMVETTWGYKEGVIMLKCLKAGDRLWRISPPSG